MQSGLKLFKPLAKPVFAGLLAALLLAFGLLAASGPLHHTIHHDDSGSANSCGVCAFAQGHVEVPDSALVLISAVFFLLCGLPPTRARIPWRLNFLLPPGRAPPAASHVS